MGSSVGILLSRLMPCNRLLQDHGDKSAQSYLFNSKDKWLWVTVHQHWFIPYQPWTPKALHLPGQEWIFPLMDILNWTFNFLACSIEIVCYPNTKPDIFSLEQDQFILSWSKLLIYICIDLTTEVKYSKILLRWNKIELFDDSQALLVVTLSCLHLFSRNQKLAKCLCYLSNHTVTSRWRAWKLYGVCSFYNFVQAYPNL